MPIKSHGTFKSYRMNTLIKLNGKTVEIQAEPNTPLLWVLRGELHQNGSKFGCGVALCGACTVHLDGEPARACVTPLSEVGQRSVTTIEGVTGAQIDALRQAWLDLDVVQCGYCQSGQLMSAAALLARIPKPTDADIDQAMNGNLCRCGTYPRVRQAIHQAANIK
jgi:isoquinoline 1-oxidoreductase alpha subunit